MSKMKNKELEDFKYLIDSRNLTDKQRRENSDALLRARAERLKERTAEEVRRSRLVQLKLQMEEYLEDAHSELQNAFTYFLGSYVDALYKKRKDFASDISISPLELSQVMNNHRKPPQKFMLRLLVHSEKTYKAICDFNEKLWHRVYYRQRINDIMSNQLEWREDVEKYVTKRDLDEDDD